MPDGLNQVPVSFAVFVFKMIRKWKKLDGHYNNFHLFAGLYRIICSLTRLCNVNTIFVSVYLMVK